jgi:hypothetical protein
MIQTTGAKAIDGEVEGHVASGLGRKVDERELALGREVDRERA